MKYIPLFLLLLPAAATNAATYYFSALTGNDSRTVLQAQDSLTPWKTLNQLNAFFAHLNPGDTVLFKRGEVFDGALQITRSGSLNLPLVFSCYGYGNRPVINGLGTLTNWIPSGNGIWKSSCAGCGTHVNVVVLNGTAQAVGRFPNIDTVNKGYLTIASHNGNTQITDNSLSDSPDWTGGEVVIRKSRWIIDRYPITAHSANTITYSVQGFNYPPADQYGYFIQNHPKTLDRSGEWCFDNNEKTVQLYFGADGPAGADVKVSVTEFLVTLHNQSHIEFHNLSFTGANENTFDIYNATNVRISDCDLFFSGANALSVYMTQYLSIENTTIRNTNNDAFIGNECFHSVIRNNTIKNTGVVRGMGKNNDDAYQAIIIRGNDNVVEFNTIDSTGYIPIRFEGNGVLVKNNFINHFALVKDDGGGIYTWQGGGDTSTNYDRKITGNIVLNGEGDGAGTSSPTYLSATGIYVDGHAGHVDISSNTVANCSLGGIFFNNPHDNVTEKNTMFDNGNQLFMEHINPDSASFSGNNLVKNNILFSKGVSQFALHLESVHNDLYTMGNFDSNYYCRPFDDHFVIFNSYLQDGKNFSKAYDLQSWQLLHGQDALSNKSPVQLPYYHVNGLIGGNRCSNSSFDTNIGGLYIYSPEGYCTPSWNNGGNLDGGALKVSFSAESKLMNIGYVITGIGSVKAGENYIVKFSLSGSKDYKHLGVFLRKSQAPYNNLTAIQYCMVSGTREEKEFLFTLSEAESDASLVFEIEEQGNPVYIDNISLQRADVTYTNADDHIIFEYNPTSFNKTILLDGTYVDVKNRLYTGTVILSPYTSLILMKQPAITLPLRFLGLNGNKINQTVSLQWTTTNEPGSDHFAVERSSNATTFRTIENVSSKNATSRTSDYSYTDSTPAAGSSYYRIKQIASDRTYNYSKTIQINYDESTGMTLRPNPARETIKVTISGTLNLKGRKCLVIQSVTGAIVKRIAGIFQDQDVVIDISSLPNGIYFTNLLYNDLVIKQQSFTKLQ